MSQSPFRDMHEDDRRCGLSSDALRTTASLPIINSTVPIVPQSQYFLAVKTDTRFFNTHCVSSVLVELQTNRTIQIDGAEIVLSAILWSRSLILSTSVPEFGDFVARQIADLTNQFIVDWQLAQAP